MRCQTCGFENPPGLKFCGDCGARLAAAEAAAEERKIVTVLFADLVGSTTAAHATDPERVRATLQRYFDAMAAEITHFGGTVEKYIGDAILAVFGLPQAHEDDPERAARAALAMQDRVAGLGLDMAVRIGLTTGEVMANPAAAQKGEFLITGDAVNLAARLQQAAEPGAVLLDERTARAVRGVIGTEALPPVALKGFPDRVAVWRALGVTAERRQRGLEGIRAPLIGRTQELEQLRATLERVRSSRRPVLVTIVGQAGVGKSRLAEEFLVTLETLPEPPRVLMGRSLPYGEGVALWALGDLIRSACGISLTDSTEAVRSKVRATVEAMFPPGEAQDAAHVRAALERVLGVGEGAASSVEEQQWLFRRFLERLAGDQPLVLIMEDAHWADDRLLAFLEYLAQWSTAVPLFLCCLTRPDLLDRRPHWAGGVRNATTLFLDPLPESETRTMVASLLGADALPEPMHARILERAEGNPFFVEEILRDLVERGLIVREAGRWQAGGDARQPEIPDSVAAVIAARLDRLAADEKRTAQEASVIGRTFWAGGLAQLVGGAPPEQLARTLRGLLTRDLVIEHDRSILEGEREYAFRHVLIRDVAYAMIPKAQRWEKHTRVAEWIHTVMGDREAEHADFIAHHLWQAVALRQELGLEPDRPSQEQALRYAMLAGQHAGELYANASALAHFTRALSVAEAIGAAAEEARAAEALGRIETRIGQWTQARTHLRRALEIHEAVGTLLDQARALGYLGELERALRDTVAAAAWYQLGLERLSTVENASTGAVRSMLLLGLAMAQMVAGGHDAARRDVVKALALATGLGDRRLLARARYQLGSIAAFSVNGDPAQARREIQEASALAAETGDLQIGSGCANAEGFLHGRAGRPWQAIEAFAQAAALAEKTGDPGARALAKHNLVLWAILVADWDLARRHLSEIVSMAHERGMAGHALDSGATLAHLEGRAEEALEQQLALIAKARGQGNAQVAVIARATAMDFAILLRKHAQVLALADAATVGETHHPTVGPRVWALGAVGALHLERFDRAQHFLECLRRFGPYPPATLPAWTAATSGLIALAQQDLVRAADLVAEAVHRFGELRARRDQGRMLGYLSVVHAKRQRGGDADRARAHLDAARAIFQGAPIELHWLEGLWEEWDVPAAP